MTTQHARPVLSVLVPAYNEEGTLGQVLDRLMDLGPLLREVIVVDDGSTDATPQIARCKAAADPRIKLLTLARNRGKTAAIGHALRHASGEIVIVQDGDLEYDPAEIPAVIAPILDGQADVVYGSRFLTRRAMPVTYYYHYLANKLLTCLSNLLTNRNMTDIETCYKAFRACVIRPLALTSRGFGMEVEITALVCRTKAQIYEVPISYYGRTYEAGKKVGLADGLAAIAYILYYNLVAPRTAAGRRYIRTVNEALGSGLRRAAENAHWDDAAQRDAA